MENQERLIVIAKRPWKSEKFFVLNELYTIMTGYALILSVNFLSYPEWVKPYVALLGVLCFIAYALTKWWQNKQDRANTFHAEFTARDGLVALLQQKESHITGVRIEEEPVQSTRH